MGRKREGKSRVEREAYRTAMVFSPPKPKILATYFSNPVLWWCCRCVERGRNISVQLLALRPLEGGTCRRSSADRQWQTHLRTKSVAAQRVLGTAHRKSLCQVCSIYYLLTCLIPSCFSSVFYPDN